MITEEKRGIWLNFPECTPEDGEQVVVKRNGWYEILVYNEYHQCWDDSEGDDYYCDLDEIDKFLRIPKEEQTYDLFEKTLEFDCNDFCWMHFYTYFPIIIYY